MRLRLLHSWTDCQVGVTGAVHRGVRTCRSPRRLTRALPTSIRGASQSDRQGEGVAKQCEVKKESGNPREGAKARIQTKPVYSLDTRNHEKIVRTVQPPSGQVSCSVKLVYNSIYIYVYRSIFLFVVDLLIQIKQGTRICHTPQRTLIESRPAIQFSRKLSFVVPVTSGRDSNACSTQMRQMSSL